MMASKSTIYFNTVCTACVFVCLFSFSIHAQVPTGNQLPEVLKDIKAAAGTCKRDDIVSNASSIPTKTEVQPDFGCAKSPIEALALSKQADTLLVDLRLSEPYQAFHIENALNLNVTDLLNKRYWYSKTVVLIGDCKAEREMYRTCAHLKQSRYKQVYVLRGGMPLWLTHNLAVSGRPPPVLQLSSLSAAEFWLESQRVENLVLLDKKRDSMQRDLSLSVVLTNITGEDINLAMASRRKESKHLPTAVVLVTDSSITEAQLQQFQQTILPTPLLVYSDTHEKYLSHVTVQKAIWAAQARGPKLPGCGL
jgi:rhodanese-related sulfurtransferase